MAIERVHPSMPSLSQMVRVRPQDRVQLPARVVRVGVALADSFLTTYQAVELNFRDAPLRQGGPRLPYAGAA